MAQALSPGQAYQARLAGRWIASIAAFLALHPNQEIEIDVGPEGCAVHATPSWGIGPELSAHGRMALAARLPHPVGHRLFSGLCHRVQQRFHLSGFGNHPAVYPRFIDAQGVHNTATLAKGLTQDWAGVAAFWGTAAALMDARLTEPLLAQAVGFVASDPTSTFPDNATAVRAAVAKAIDAMARGTRADSGTFAPLTRHALRRLPLVADPATRRRLHASADAAIPDAWIHAQAGFAQGPLGPA